MRDDYVLISQTYFDQSMQPIKRMETLEIGELGGRTFGTRMRMAELDQTDSYTELYYATMDWDVELNDRLFTVFSLQSGATP